MTDVTEHFLVEEDGVCGKKIYLCIRQNEKNKRFFIIMKKKYYHQQGQQGTTVRVNLRLIAMLAFLLLVQAARGDRYITFKDGRLLVFPSQYVSDIATGGGILSFTTIDGRTYNYPTADIRRVDSQLTKALPEMTSFVVDNKLNYQLFGDAQGVINGQEITVEALAIGKRLTPTFELTDEQAQATVRGAAQRSGESRLRFDESVVYTVGYPGDRILTRLESGELGFAPYGRDYTVTVDFLTDHATTVPRIDINTVDSVDITSKEEYVDAEIIIDGAGIFPSMTDSVQIKGRGHTSWSTNPKSKNPYRLKFSSKVKPLGLSKGKNWVLLANKIIGSMMTNAIGMKAASLIGTPAANHIIPVDLYINGVYKGSYNFTEKIGLSGNSVKVDDESVATLLELDKYYDDPWGQKFTSTPYNIPINVKEPEFYEEGTTMLTLEDVKSRFDEFASAVSSGADFDAYVDIDYLARYLMLNELVCNYEIFHPKSVYCYHENILSDTCRFIFGPAWDFDWSFGYQTNTNYFKSNTDIHYYQVTNLQQQKFFTALRNNPKVAQRLLELWRGFINNGLDELCEYCQDYYDFANPSLTKNRKANAVEYTKYDIQTTLAQSWLRDRALAVYAQMQHELIVPGDANGDGQVSIDDVVALIDAVLGNASPDTVIAANADLDDDGAMEISDVILLITMVLEL